MNNIEHNSMKLPLVTGKDSYPDSHTAVWTNKQAGFEIQLYLDSNQNIYAQMNKDGISHQVSGDCIKGLCSKKYPKAVVLSRELADAYLIIRPIVTGGYTIEVSSRGRGGGKDDDLIFAAGEGKLEKVKTLISKGANVNHRRRITVGDTVLSSTALSKAARNGHRDVCKYLLEKGAEIDAISLAGDTALHMAALQGRTDVVRLLVDWGARTDIANKRNKTALDFAKTKGFTTIAEIIESGSSANTSEVPTDSENYESSDAVSGHSNATPTSVRRPRPSKMEYPAAPKEVKVKVSICGKLSCC